ncbi:MAG: YqaJ viral recombinase family protein [Gemmataceae bacterium]|nr:YqaJ viral recombinase family protein [Gemmataceae bacterium]
MKVVNCVQYSPEWWEARRGVPTASRFDRILTPKTSKPSSQQEPYTHELIADRVRFDPRVVTDRPMNAAMRHGVDCEPEARDWYALEGNHDVQQVGFCLTDDGRMGCSPDGLVGTDGLLEIKCPEPKTHVGYLMAGTLPDEYRCQVHGQLLVTGRRWCDFFSYCPGFDPFLIRVAPDEFTDRLASELARFVDRLDAAWAAFVAKHGRSARRT